MIKKIFNKLFKKKDCLSFQQGYDLTELPIVTLYQKDKKLNFLLDTGSNNSIIDKSILSDIEYEETETKSNLSGLEGTKQVVSMCNLTISYKDKEFKYCYLICDMSVPFGAIKQETGVTLHGILGSKFFNEFKYIIDFNELIAYSKA